MAILSGEEIKRQIELKNINVSPYDERRVQPASIDLTLGNEARIYATPYDVLDARAKNETCAYCIGPDGFVVLPGVLYLMHTAERIHTNSYVSVLDGKSSIARLGVVIHLTAGYGDPGFDGQYTLEVTSVHPVRLYTGMAIAQMRFHVLEGAVSSYSTKGHYIGADARGAVPSMSYKQFEDS